PEEPFLDGWVTLAAWAAVTTHVRLGTLVTNLTWRSPVLVARAAVALDQVRMVGSNSAWAPGRSQIRPWPGCSTCRRANGWPGSPRAWPSSTDSSVAT